MKRKFKGVMKILREHVVFHVMQPYVRKKYVEMYLDVIQLKKLKRKYGYIKVYNRKNPKRFRTLAYFWHIHSIVEGE